MSRTVVNLQIAIPIIAAVLLTLAASIITSLIARIYVRRVYKSIDTILDGVINNGAVPHYSVTRETRLSKLTHKASRVIELYLQRAEQSKEERDKLQSFVSDMSHQMKTPLAVISMYVDLLGSQGLTEQEREEFIGTIKVSADKLQWMMDCLIKMSRLEIGAVQLSPVIAGVRETIEESIASVIGAAKRRGIAIITADFEDYTAHHDVSWTREALVNVLENAIKYSPENSEINITVEQFTLYTKISVADHGVGISRQDLNMIFKRFYRGKNVQDKEGAGLGLYLAELIMNKQGGYINAESNGKKGTKFSLFLRINETK